MITLTVLELFAGGFFNTWMFGLGAVTSATADAFLAVQPIFAAAADALKDKLKQVLDIIMLFGFLYGTVRIIGGAIQMRRGETEEGKQSILSGALIAAAPLIMRVLFEILFKDTGL